MFNPAFVLISADVLKLYDPAMYWLSWTQCHKILTISNTT